MKRIAILGSTGSIGKSTLEVIRHHPQEFTVIGLSANSNIDILYKQIKEFKPAFVCISDRHCGLDLYSKLKGRGIRFFLGEEGLCELVADKRIDKIVLAISGAGALKPFLKAIDSGKDISLANKEALVMAGEIIMNKAKKKKINIIPIDSEQSAIWQCLHNQDKEKLKNIYLTASGGPFHRTPRRNLKKVSVRQVLKHPRWKMGRKITVDSANLMNKGLEIIEAMHLFNLTSEKIKIVIHPEAIIHSMVEFIDGVILAQLSITDMRIPIQYAISYPERLTSNLSGVDFYKLKSLTFERPDYRKFPSLTLAYYVAKEGGTTPCVFNAANEVCVNEFLRKNLPFISITGVIEKVLQRHHNVSNPCLNDILEADAWARLEALKIIRQN